jgi:hypothetical protein
MQHLSNDLSQVRSTRPEFSDMTESSPDPGRSPLYETASMRPRSPAMPIRDDRTGVRMRRHVIGRARGDLLCRVPTGMSSGVAAASLCAASEGRRPLRLCDRKRRSPLIPCSLRTISTTDRASPRRSLLRLPKSPVPGGNSRLSLSPPPAGSLTAILQARGTYAGAQLARSGSIAALVAQPSFRNDAGIAGPVVDARSCPEQQTRRRLERCW